MFASIQEKHPAKFGVNSQIGTKTLTAESMEERKAERGAAAGYGIKKSGAQARANPQEQASAGAQSAQAATTP